MKIILLSDTHSRMHEMTKLINKTIEEYNIEAIFHCGDFGESIYKIIDFFKWFSAFNVETKIVIPGNHELYIEKHEEHVKELSKYYLVDLLINESIDFNGFKVYGSPYTPEFHNWAYNRTNKQLSNDWENIPDDTNILLTHGPAYGCLDKVIRGDQHVGCKHLTKRIKELNNLQYHFFGHIHESRGYEYNNNILNVNASSVNLQYKYQNEIYIVDLETQEIIIISEENK